MRVILSFACVFASLFMFAQDVNLGHWKFNGSLMDESFLQNNGNLVGGVYGEGRHGGSDSAIYFDGINDGVSIPHFSEFNRDTLTISFWFKAQDTILKDHPSFPYRAAFLFFKGASTSANQSSNNFSLYQLDASTQKLGVSISKSSSNTNTTTLVDSIEVNQWHNVVSVLVGKKHYLYFDGELIEARPLNGMVNKNTKFITLGYQEDESGRRFRGAMDDLKISSKAWTAADVYDEFELPYCTRIVYDTVKVMDTLVIDFDDEVLFAYENELSGSVKVFPNPSSDKVIVAFAGYSATVPHTLELVNSLGEVIFTESINSNNIEISLNEAGEGIYYLRIKNNLNQIKVTKKIVVR